MYPVVYGKAISLLHQGESLTKDDLAAKAPCHERTAQRLLLKMCKNQEIHISSWVLKKNVWIPRYRIGAGKNKSKPRAMTKVERARKMRQNPEYREKEARNARMRRLKNGAFKSRAKHELFNLIVMRPS